MSIKQSQSTETEIRLSTDLGQIQIQIHRPQELSIQRHAARRRGVRRHVLNRDHGQDERPEPAQVRAVAARGDAQRRRPGRPGLPRLADAVVGIRTGGNQAEVEGRRGGR